MPYKDIVQRYIFTQNRRTAVLAVLVAVGIGIVFLIVQRQSPAEWRSATAAGEGLTIKSFNVLKGGQPVSDAIDAVAAADPDLVCLQEMTAELAKAGFRDSCSAPRSACGPTWPGYILPWPATFRIDYILGRDVRFADSAVLQAGGSDHYPVVTRVVATAKSLESKVSEMGQQTRSSRPRRDRL